MQDGSSVGAWASSSEHDLLLIITLTLCAIVALIWWLTGSSQHPAPIVDPELQAEVVEDALDRLSRSGGGALSSPQSARVGGVLLETLVAVGMEESTAVGTVERLGYDVRVDTPEDPPPRGLTVFSMKDEHARAALERALLVGVQLARMDDDYAGVSDDTLAFASLRQRAEEVETELFDDRRRALLDFYSRAVLVLQDRIQSEPDADRRSTAAIVLGRFDAELISLQEEMSRAMAELPEDPEAIFWGDSEDRRRYYFKMGVTNSLRRSGHLSSLGSLYRFRGVNYDVDEAYQLAGEEEPLLLRAASLDFSTLISLGPPDVRRLTNERALSRPVSQTES